MLRWRNGLELPCVFQFRDERREAYVRVSILQQYHPLKTKRTSTVRSPPNESSPVFSECFNFRVRASNMDITSLSLQLYQPVSGYGRGKISCDDSKHATALRTCNLNITSQRFSSPQMTNEQSVLRWDIQLVKEGNLDDLCDEEDPEEGVNLQIHAISLLIREARGSRHECRDYPVRGFLWFSTTKGKCWDRP